MDTMAVAADAMFLIAGSVSASVSVCTYQDSEHYVYMLINHLPTRTSVSGNKVLHSPGRCSIVRNLTKKTTKMVKAAKSSSPP